MRDLSNRALLLCSLLFGVLVLWQVLLTPGLVFSGELKTSAHYWVWLRPLLSAWSERFDLGYATHTAYVSAGLPEFYAYSLVLMWPLLLLLAISTTLFGAHLGLPLVYMAAIAGVFWGLRYLIPLFSNTPYRNFWALLGGLVIVGNGYLLPQTVALGAIYPLAYTVFFFWLGHLGYYLRSLAAGQIAWPLLLRLILLTCLLSTMTVGFVVIAFYVALVALAVFVWRSWRGRQLAASWRPLTLSLLILAAGLVLLTTYIWLPALFSHEAGRLATLTSFSTTVYSFNSILMPPLLPLGEPAKILSWSLLILGLTVVGVVFGRLRHKLWLAAALVTGLLMVAGAHPATESLYNWLRSWPLLDLSRSGHRYMVLVLLPMALLLPAAIERFSNLRQVKKHLFWWLAAGLLFTLQLGLNPALLSGTLGDQLVAVAIPKTYADFGDWLKRKGLAGQPVLVLPRESEQSITGQYDWSPLFAAPSPAIWRHPFVGPNPVRGQLVLGADNSLSQTSRFFIFAASQAGHNPAKAVALLTKSQLPLVALDRSSLKWTSRQQAALAAEFEAFDWEEVTDAPEPFVIWQRQASRWQVVDQPDLLVGDLHTAADSAVAPFFILLNQEEQRPLALLESCTGCRVIFDRLAPLDLAAREAAAESSYTLRPNLSPRANRSVSEEWIHLNSIADSTAGLGLMVESSGSPVSTFSSRLLTYNLPFNREPLVLVAKVIGGTGWELTATIDDQTVVSADTDQNLGQTSRYIELGRFTPQTDSSLLTLYNSHPGREIVIERVMAISVTKWEALLTAVNESLARHLVWERDAAPDSQVASEKVVMTKHLSALQVATAPRSGWLFARQSINRDWQVSPSEPAAGNYFGAIVPVQAGDQVRFSYSLASWYRVGQLISAMTLLTLLLLILQIKIKKRDV